MNLRYMLWNCLFLLLMNACVEEIDLGRSTPADFLVVDGILNYHPLADSSDLVVKLSLSRNNYVRTIPISDASMELVVSGKDTYPLLEREPGNYYLFNTNVFQTGVSYQLRFQIDEQQYESTPEILPDSVALERVYSELNTNGTPAKAFELFVDLQDDANTKNYYRWLITLWEKQEYCLFCYRVGRNPENCVTNDLYGTPSLTISRNVFCDGGCYDILRFSDNNTISDIFSNGKLLLKKSIGFIPFHFYSPCLVEVKQSSLTPSYFAFLEVLKTQAESTGGLADTPAALLVGNVKNLTNPSEKVVGYFSVTNNSVRRYWLDRKPALDFGFKALASQNPPLAPPTPTPILWYPVPCKASATRTPIKPRGWRG